MPLVSAKAKKICSTRHDKPNLFGVSGKFAVDRLPSAQQYKSRELARIREVFVVRKIVLRSPGEISVHCFAFD
jgi:hypothetical protein